MGVSSLPTKQQLSSHASHPSQGRVSGAGSSTYGLAERIGGVTVERSSSNGGPVTPHGATAVAVDQPHQRAAWVTCLASCAFF
jgi:hypothetical protein